MLVAINLVNLLVTTHVLLKYNIGIWNTHHEGKPDIV